MRLTDKTAIISGAASGMGAATARLFAREGANVVVTDLLQEEGESLVRDIGSSGGTAMFLHLDVTSEAAWEAVTQASAERFGAINVLVNNAGISGSDPDLFSMSTWEQQMEVNAKSVFLGMRAVVPYMRKAGGGSIVNISSISGLVGQTVVHMGYNSAKGAVRMATKAAAVQLAPENIRVNSVHPGMMPPMRTSQMTADPEVRKKMLRAVPMRREGKVEEVAYANLFLASDESSYVTGIEMPVDGGYVAM